MTNIAVILAGGIGSRVGGPAPKQLLLLEDGRSILEHSIDAFEQAPCIDQIGIVMHKDYIAQAEAMVQCNGWKKVAWVIPGGDERWQSSVNALNRIHKDIVDINAQEGQTKIDEESVNVLLHDAARPFVSQQIIQDVCTALTHYKAVTVALPATDTIYQVHYVNNENNFASGDAGALARGYANYGNNVNYGNNGDDCVISTIPPRQSIMYAQTPQAFRLTTISEAYRLALQDPNLQATDDCGIVHEYLPTTNIHIVPGSPSNRKITYPEDLNNQTR